MTSALVKNVYKLQHVLMPPERGHTYDSTGSLPVQAELLDSFHPSGR